MDQHFYSHTLELGGGGEVWIYLVITSLALIYILSLDEKRAAKTLKFFLKKSLFVFSPEKTILTI